MAEPKPISKAMRDLWADLNETIRERAGAVVSRPDVSPVRFECEQDSDLPWHLSRRGFEVGYVGVSERLWPTKCAHARGDDRRSYNRCNRVVI